MPLRSVKLAAMFASQVVCARSVAASPIAGDCRANLRTSQPVTRFLEPSSHPSCPNGRDRWLSGLTKGISAFRSAGKQEEFCSLQPQLRSQNIQPPVRRLRSNHALYRNPLNSRHFFVRAKAAASSSEPAEAAVSGDAGRFSFPKAPVFMKAPVVTGFGRGSKQMGIPTANMLPDVLREQLEGMERGVYFGWARLPHLEGGTGEQSGGGEEGEEKGKPEVYKMVLNIGRRPTFVDGDDVTVEVHILSLFEDDFYGEELQVVVLGYIRPERKFSSLDDLVTQIQSDISTASGQLDTEAYAQFAREPFFSQ